MGHDVTQVVVEVPVEGVLAEDTVTDDRTAADIPHRRLGEVARVFVAGRGRDRRLAGDELPGKRVEQSKRFQVHLPLTP